MGCLLFLGALKQNMLPTTVVFAAFYGQELVRAAFSRNRFFFLGGGGGGVALALVHPF